MRKRNNFISVFTMFLAIGFAIIFSIPVKATANGVQLKTNRTYAAYDVTGDGMKDKIRIRAANPPTMKHMRHLLYRLMEKQLTD